MKTIANAFQLKTIYILVVLMLYFIEISRALTTDNLKDKTFKDRQPINIAIIGASFSGCSVSYYLNKLFEKYDKMFKLNITIFDKNSKISLNFLNKKIQNTIVDVYQPFIYEWQTNLKKLAKEFSLELKKYNQSNSIGIYDGEEFLISESNKNFINKLKEVYPEDMSKMLNILQRFHKSLQSILINNDNNVNLKSLDDFINSFNGNFPDHKSLFGERTDVYFNNFDINFSFIDRIIRGFLYAQNLKGTDNNAFSSLLTILSQLNNKYYLENGILDMANKLVYDNPYYNVNTFLKLNTIIKKIEEKVVNESKHSYEEKNKCYSITALNTDTGKIEKYDSFDIVIISDECPTIPDFEIVDSDFSKDQKEKNFGFFKNRKTLYNHILLGNINSNYFFSKANTYNNKNLYSEAKESELNLLEQELKKADESIINNRISSKKQFIPDVVLTNDNQGFTEFSQIQMLCKNCYFNRYSDENKHKYNSVLKIVSLKEKLSNELLKNIFDGRVIYEDQKGFGFPVLDRKGFISAENNQVNARMPEFEICKNRLFNNIAFNYIDDNLEFNLLSSKNIANLILKNFINDELEILSSDF